MTKSNYHISRGGFSELYFRLRQKEGRIYSDNEVLQLPDIRKDHPLRSEWQLRRESSHRLETYLKKNKNFRRILEIGSGNGWLSRRLAALPSCHATGVELNSYEYRQARRVFDGTPRLQFLSVDLGKETLEEKDFDCAILAASLQYFPSLQAAVRMSFRHLRPGGELHIIDTPFYRTEELAPAKMRSRNYFHGMGFPEMTVFYFHHCLNALEEFDYKILYRPNTLHRLLGWNKNPFPWIRIKKP